MALRFVWVAGFCFRPNAVRSLPSQAKMPVGIVTVDQLKKGRRYAIVGMFIAAAVLTPPDVISQVGLAVPLLLLYELSIIAATWMNRPKKTSADKTKT